jgi:mannose-6-phosphate isomerase-like protein (cupin superfamily)
MSVPGEIGDEVHTVDQILTFTSGEGLATINGKNQTVQAGDVVVVSTIQWIRFLNQSSIGLGASWYAASIC